MICRHDPQGIAPSLVISAMTENWVYPWAMAENIAHLSAHKVVGKAFDSILQPKIIIPFSASKAAPTGYLL